MYNAHPQPEGPGQPFKNPAPFQQNLLLMQGEMPCGRGIARDRHRAAKAKEGAADSLPENGTSCTTFHNLGSRSAKARPPVDLVRSRFNPCIRSGAAQQFHPDPMGREHKSERKIRAAGDRHRFLLSGYKVYTHQLNTWGRSPRIGGKTPHSSSR